MQQKERKKLLKKDAKVLYPTWKFLVCKAGWKGYELEEVILRKTLACDNGMEVMDGR